ncbi:hypothetical protein GGI25_003658 [Coemansia spiralis]|uniref:Uncharacterized protein n=2 Tax=Coemansia TaxID=4863 RepID=A0A9W8KXY4_9FUNG|nr:hypothetical protein BX070DRAFT_251197 [Coemansia spiralis]KAJ1996112.1 hypothetical protein EDC05_000002 [Coemansia umbellata]KAJ2626130.1 hypothetical protein GGI26_000214 [Coemansia sp. RSA 1358]KAJ2676271.1 hypothetical protein GGI25_003658 [Coemansia spiralis]
MKTIISAVLLSASLAVAAPQQYSAISPEYTTTTTTTVSPAYTAVPPVYTPPVPPVYTPPVPPVYTPSVPTVSTPEYTSIVVPPISTAPAPECTTTSTPAYTIVPPLTTCADDTATSEPAHHLRTFTNNQGYTLLIDEANNELGGLIVGASGVDGIYNVDEEQPASGIDTWVDIHDGVNVIIDYANPNDFTVYDSNSEPIDTISFEVTPISSPLSHYLMAFVNDKSETLLVDEAVDDAAILEAGIDGIDGIYTVPPDGFPTGVASGIETWVDSADGIQAIVDLANPNYFTVFDESSNPIATVSY